jgi:oligosaccharide repeat unit polymerase
MNVSMNWSPARHCGSTALAAYRPYEWALGLFPLLTGLLATLCESHDAMRILLVLNLCGNVCLLLTSARSILRTHRIGWLILLSAYTAMFYFEGVLLAFGTPSFAGSPATRIGQYSNEAIRRGLLCLGIFQAAFILSWSGPAPVFRSLARRRLLTPRAVLYPLCLCGYIPLIAIRGLDLNALFRELLNARTVRFSGDYSEAGWLQYTSALAFYPSACLLAKCFCGKGARRWADLGMGVIGSVPCLASGSRHMLLFVLGPVALVWFYAKVRRFRFRTVLGGVALIIIVLLILQLQYAVRYKGWDAVADVGAADFGLGRASTMFETLLFATSMVPEVHRFYMEPMTPFFITHWIPRKLWPGKPESRSYVGISQAWTGTPDLTRYNVPPSIVGQYYINWSYAGVLVIGCWMGLLTKVLDLHTLEARKGRSLSMLVLCGSGYILLVNLLRIYHPFYSVYFVWMVLTACLCSALGRFLGLGVKLRQIVGGRFPRMGLFKIGVSAHFDALPARPGMVLRKPRPTAL